MVPSTSAAEDDNETVSTMRTSMSFQDHVSRDFEVRVPDSFIGDNDNDEGQLVDDPHSPYHIQSKIKLAIERWNTVTPIAPDRFLAKLLSSRGYDTTLVASSSLRETRGPPTPKQVSDYDVDIVNAVRTSDMNALKRLFAEGRSMSACNKFSESIVHMACRRSSFVMVDFILRNGGHTDLVDDYGRTPLHDACWRMIPQFDVVTLLLDRNIDLLRVMDVRGAHALKYVGPDQWLEWCAYFYYQKDKYWPAREKNP